MNDDPSMLTEEQAAEMLGVPVKTLRWWRKSGKPPKYVKLNGVLRYSAADLAAFIVDSTVDRIKAKK